MEDTDDQISNLPDAIWSHILSFLPTSDAVQTSLLSRRCRYMSTTTASLDFNFMNFPETNQKIPAFLEFVNQSLNLHDVLRLRKIRLSFPKKFLPHASDWIAFAIRHSIEELDFHIPDITVEKLPEMIFTYESLKVLKLNLPLIVLELPASVRLSGLRTLHLESINFHNSDVLWELISNCPVLENLGIVRCLLYEGLNLYSHTLQNLRIHDCLATDIEIKVWAPSLRSFKYFGPMAKFSLKNLFSITDAFIDFHSSFAYLRGSRDCTQAINILQQFKHVRDLSLGPMCIEFLSADEDLLRSLPFHFCNLRHLKLTMCYKKSYIHVMTCLLNSCPNLESLSAETFREAPFKLWPVKQALDHGNETKSPSVYDLRHLKTLQMERCHGENKFELVEYLIKNSKVLKPSFVKVNKFGVEVDCLRSKPKSHRSSFILSGERCRCLEEMQNLSLGSD